MKLEMNLSTQLQSVYPEKLEVTLLKKLSWNLKFTLPG